MTQIRIKFATYGSQAVILRQGPQKWTRMSTWNTKTDEVVHGQWIRSKIPQFDINSDASLLLAFVQSYRRIHQYDTWVALSRPPWFSALAIWHIGDSWGGDCTFLSDHSLYIAEGMQPVHMEGKLARGMRWTSDKNKYPQQNHLERAGWTTRMEDGFNNATKYSELSGMQICSQPLAMDARIDIFFQKTRKAKPEYLETLDAVFFSDFDCYGRLIFTRRNGRVYRATLKNKVLAITEIFDFSTMKPEPISAPAEATEW